MPLNINQSIIVVNVTIMNNNMKYYRAKRVGRERGGPREDK